MAWVVALLFPRFPSQSRQHLFSMGEDIFKGQLPAIHFYLLGCFLEQRRMAFLVQIEANSEVMADPRALAALFLKEMVLGSAAGASWLPDPFD